MIDIDHALLRTMPLPAHDGEVDKDERGRVLAVGGCVEVPGGILLASVAALRAGAGKLQIATCRSIAPALGIAVPEALVIGLDETTQGCIVAGAAAALEERLARCDALLIGPGMMSGEAAAEFTRALMLIECEAGLVLDAAALTRLGGEDAALRARPGQAVLTPHAGEMAALMGLEREAVRADPEAVARDAAARFDSVVALKGPSTVVADPGGATYRYHGGGVGLATSGSGDTLAGIVTGLRARGTSPLVATLWAVFLHGEAGNRLAETRGRIGYLARELLDEIPQLMVRLDLPHAAASSGG